MSPSILCAFLIGSAALSSPSICAARIAPSTAAVSQYSKFETSFTIANQTGNPFDPTDNDVDAVIAGPHGLRAVVPAFWDGDRWRVRYAPAAIGAYSIAITRNGKAVSVNGLTASGFQSVASHDAGFVRVSAKTAQKFVFDNTQPYYPIGINIAWRNGGDPTYPVYFDHMEQTRLNWARVWMNNWDGKNLEWAADSAKNPKIGEFLLDVARQWDGIIDSASQHGVYVQMVLQHHGQYTEKTDPNWQGNPFNAANGGFLKKPDDFFTDAEARRLTKAKYRYIVARWGYSDHILAFELFNEVQNIGENDSHFQDVINWHKEMAAYLRSVDVNHHLITTSYSDPGNPLSQIGLDYDQIHSYPPDVVSTFASLRTKGLKTPVFFGEWGPPTARPEDLPGLVHDGLWAGLAAPTAGAQQYWYWDRVAAQNLWPIFASAGAFVQSLGVPYLKNLQPVDVTVSTSGPKGDLSFAPPGGWGPTTQTDVTLSAASAPNLSGVSSYIQGESNRRFMPHPLLFHVNSQTPFQFQVLIGSLGKGGAHPTLSLDGAAPKELDFPASDRERSADQILSVDVPAGAHTLSLFNTGGDWFIVKRIIATAYAPGVAVMAKANAASALFWAYDRNRAAKTARTATLRFDHITPGKYRVRLWSPVQGKSVSAFPAHVSKNGILTVSLPSFVGDIAGVVSPL